MTSRFAEAEPLYLQASRSAARCSAKGARSSPRAWPTSETCTRPWAGWPRPSRCSWRRARSGDPSWATDHPDYASGLSSLAKLYESMGKPAEALRRAGRSRRDPPPHPRRRSSHLRRRAQRPCLVCAFAGQLREALSLYRQARRICRRTLGKDHPSYAASLGNLGHLYVDMGAMTGRRPCSVWRQRSGIARQVPTTHPTCTP